MWVPYPTLSGITWHLSWRASRRRCRSSAGEVSGIVRLYRWRVEIVEWERCVRRACFLLLRQSDPGKIKGLHVSWDVFPG